MCTTDEATKIHGGMRPWIRNPWELCPAPTGRRAALPVRPRHRQGGLVKASQIRSSFLNTFKGVGHSVVPSAPLIPHNDPTLFFVNAGMVPFKDVFTGAEQRPYTRATSVQKCLRVSGKHNDLEVVGRTPRHHTFFEMLGNFSFGDYFKADAIPYAWHFLTEVMQLDPSRLWVTIYEDDDEAYDLWRSSVDFPASRLQRLGAADNFWSMGDTGPCGPCTEIHWDHGPSVSSCTKGPAGGSDRYVEIWNLVFMQYNQAADGSRTPLPRPSIDTGMGLERLAAIKQGVFSNYDTDLFQPLIQRAARAADVRYGTNAEVDVALRVLADHARATSFLIADGVMPSNEGRGYVLRRIMRRAIRFGVKIGLERSFLHTLTDEVAQGAAVAYPELDERSSFVSEVVQAEEARFRRTLERGSKLLDEAMAEAGDGGTLSGEVAFTLSDTFGFPLDLTRLIAAERGVQVDEPGYEAALGRQQAAGRAAWKGSGEQAVGEHWQQLAEAHGPTVFTGYASHEASAEVLALFKAPGEGEPPAQQEAVSQLLPGETGTAVLDRTPFYGESGGQVGDAGQLEGIARVTDVTKASGLHLHAVQVTDSPLRVGQVVRAQVDGRRRDHTRRNHTATHLLHAALRKVLGEHVTQKGSLVAPDRLRFDFSHHKPVSAAELDTIESLVNEQILANAEVQTRVQSIDEARAAGAMALFGEKYDDEVRVVNVPGFSLELCGGTHVARTGDIGLFRITTETGIAAGVRRIEAQTGHGALNVVREQAIQLQQAAEALKCDAPRLLDAIERLKDDRRAAERQVQELKTEIERAAASDLKQGAINVNGVHVLAARFDGDLRAQADRLRDQLGSSVIILGGLHKDKVSLLAATTKDVAGRVHAGKLIQQLAPHIQGRGGGRPDMAQAGGSDASGLDAALEAAITTVKAALAT